ncbi:MAG: ABC-2 family transporter protein [Christensenellaceae bacterium]|jgi:ABC-2 type transport system permease protein|nr:ABC-2 family transporter protein [Christensenellaceae bacterium]
MLYFKYIKMLLRSAMEYRASFFMGGIGQFFVAFFSFASMFLLFDRFGSIAGWSFAEAALCFAVTNAAFGISECVGRGFDVFDRMVVSGEFDRVLLRPRGTALQVLGSGFELGRVGSVLQSLVVLGLAVSWLPGWSFPKALILGLMILSGVAVFVGIFIVGGALSFFTVEGLEAVNVVSYGGRQVASYPLTIYPKWIVRFFSFIIPFGCFNYLPLLYLTGRAGGNALLYMLTPLLGLLFLVPCLLVWRFGVRHYLSTGN